MAEYTIPKPYRDFYVTNPYIELKESNERLQRIVKGGYVATDSFEGHFNQVLTSGSPKHGFSLTNDASIVSTSWSMNFKDDSLWEQGSISSVDGTEMSSTQRIRTKDFYPAYNGATYKMEYSSISSSTNILIADFYKEDKTTYISSNTYLANNGSTVPDGACYMRLRVRRDEDITVSSIMDDLNSLTLKITAYTAPSDVTVKVAENVAGIPTTADGWEQGSLQTTSGNPATSTTVIRTKGFIDVNGNKQYTFKANSSVAYKGSVYEYKKDGSFIITNGLTSLPFSVSLSKDTRKIKLLLYKGTYPDPILPSDIFSELSFPRLVGDEMIVQSDDTRIVTMPPFTSLYIESNVPYHGHALDLSE